MKTVILINPYVNGFESDSDPVALAYLEQLKEVHEALLADRLYVEFIAGDRKGSIAKATLNPAFEEPKPPCIKHSYRRWDPNIKFQFENTYLYVLGTWKGRRNKIQLQLPMPDAVCLIGNNIETVWNVFDAKSAKEEVLKNPDQRDIDGNVLAVGDEVMYINLRYGAGGTLCRGKVKEFKVVVNTSSTSITTVIESDSGEESALKYPHNMVSKIG